MCDICNTIEKSLRGENSFFVKELETGIVVLGWNQHFYGYTIFICKQHATELYQLDKDFCARFMEEMVKEIMWNKDNIPNEQELKKMKAQLLKELDKYEI